MNANGRPSTNLPPPLQLASQATEALVSTGQPLSASSAASMATTMASSMSFESLSSTSSAASASPTFKQQHTIPFPTIYNNRDFAYNMDNTSTTINGPLEVNMRNASCTLDGDTSSSPTLLFDRNSHHLDQFPQTSVNPYRMMSMPAITTTPESITSMSTSPTYPAPPPQMHMVFPPPMPTIPDSNGIIPSPLQAPASTQPAAASHQSVLRRSTRISSQESDELFVPTSFHRISCGVAFIHGDSSDEDVANDEEDDESCAPTSLGRSSTGRKEHLIDVSPIHRHRRSNYGSSSGSSTGSGGSSGSSGSGSSSSNISGPFHFAEHSTSTVTGTRAGNGGSHMETMPPPPTDPSDWRARLRYCEIAPNKAALDANMVRLLDFPEGLDETEIAARRAANLRFDKVREQRLKDRNNEAAKRSRQRKVTRIEIAERRAEELVEENVALRTQMQQMQQMMAQLQLQLAEAQRQQQKQQQQQQPSQQPLGSSVTSTATTSATSTTPLGDCGTDVNTMDTDDAADETAHLGDFSSLVQLQNYTAMQA